ncbi:tripartite tricarboxylate transporter substrate binding protein [Variovorax gossypii]|jgi:tripartite-type tricarboxylate transporter receptor subunit TctC
MRLNKKIAMLFSAGAMLAAAGMASADNYPSRTIRMVVPFPPGGSVDYIARIVVPKFAEQIGQTVIIDNKGGASGSIGTAEVAKANPDGYTLLMVFDSHAVNHHLYKLPYDTFKSFDYLSQLVSAPMLLATSKTFRPNSVAEMIAYAKSRPDGITYGSSGTGGSNHLDALAFADSAGIKAMHVPYKGGGPMITAVMAGEVDYVVTTMPVVLGQVKEAGKLKALAVTSKARVPQLPDTPTVAETLPGYEASSWVGMMAPAGLPKDVSLKIQAAMKKALDTPEVKNRLTSEGFQIIGSTPEAFLETVRAESDAMGKLIQQRNIKVE